MTEKEEIKNAPDRIVCRKLIEKDENEIASAISSAIYCPNVFKTQSKFLNTTFSNLTTIYVFILRTINSFQSRRFFEHLFNFETEMKFALLNTSFPGEISRFLTGASEELSAVIRSIKSENTGGLDCSDDKILLNKYDHFLSKLSLQLRSYNTVINEITSKDDKN